MIVTTAQLFKVAYGKYAVGAVDLGGVACYIETI
jgi:hypothetical protein